MIRNAEPDLIEPPSDSRHAAPPPLDLLVHEENRNHATGEETDKQAKVIAKQFERRGIKVSLADAVSTNRMNSFLFDLQDDDTSRIAKIDETLRRMLEMALGVAGVCIAAPAPNESLISVEVSRGIDGEPVRLAPFVERARVRELHLPCPLGEDSRGRVQLIDLACDCHVLAAGQTGSGKSVFLKTLVCTVAMCCDPEDVRLVLVDGKGLDLTIFDELPHCACEVITDPTAAFRALRWLHEEMMRRHQVLRAAGCTDLWMHRAAMRAHDRLRSSPPAIVVVIDEVQILTQDDRKHGEELIRALSQQGRACGIVFVLATQRPSADILQGSIKANMASRISFRLPSQVDSRVILDQPGAELLVGPGNMIALSPSRSGSARLHAPLVQDDELRRICGWLSERYESKPLFSLEQRRRTVSECDREDSWPGDGTDKITRSGAREAPRRPRLTPRFVRVQADQKKLERRLARDYPEQDVTIGLSYLPCVLVALRGTWRRRHMLFALDSGAFITSMTPFRAVPLWSRLSEHGDAERLANLIPGRHKPHAEAGDDDEPFWRMAGRGLLIVGKKGFQVEPSLTRPPVLQDRLRLELVPPKNGMSWPPPAHVQARIARLRRELAQLWRLNAEKQTLVGLPIYEVELSTNVRLHIAAWTPLRENVGLQDQIPDDLFGFPCR